ncbi:MAG TPA: class I SAM-dependent methyltransferase [Vicinamibacterales bacterium]|jgi:SAM-dependent methyltransferase
MSDEYAAIAELYDHVTLYRDRADVAFFVDAAVQADGPVLEVGCGTGRVLIPTARAGIEITGLDLSSSMLDVCRRRLRDEPVVVQHAVTLVQTDMRHFDLGHTFALATIPFRPFQHLLTIDDQLACLACIRRHLVDGGRLIFDLFNPSLDALVNLRLGEESGAEPEFVMPDGRRVIRCFKVVAADRFEQINDIELIYDVTHPDGTASRLVHAFRMRYLFRYEVEHLLARSGFVVEHLYAGYDRSAYGSTYPGELVFVAKRA